MDFVEYLRIFRRRWRLLAACVAVVLVVAWLTTPSDEAATTYEVSHTIIVDESSNTAPQPLETVALFVEVGEVPIRVAERLDWSGSINALVGRVDVEPDTLVGTVRITGRADSPAGAAELTNAFARETLELLAAEAQGERDAALEDLQEQMSALEEQYGTLDAQIQDATARGENPARLLAEQDLVLNELTALREQERTIEATPAGAGYITLEAASAERAVAVSSGLDAPTSLPVRLGAGLLLGLLLGGLAVLVLERLDPHLHTRAATQKVFGLPVLAEVPVMRKVRGTFRILAVDEPSGLVAESYRAVRSSLLLVRAQSLAASTNGKGAQSAPEPGDGALVVVVTSSVPGEGKTTTVANLAATFAEMGRRVLVLGCDFRRPEVHRYLGVSNFAGLTDALALGADRAALAAVVRDSVLPRVQVVAAGTMTDSWGGLAAAAAKLIASARELADVVLIDTAPMLATNDAFELIPYADAVVVVARAGLTTRESALRTTELLQRLEAPVTGVVMIGGREAARYAGYEYYLQGPPVTRTRGRRKRAKRSKQAATTPAAGGPAPERVRALDDISPAVEVGESPR